MKHCVSYYQKSHVKPYSVCIKKGFKQLSHDLFLPYAYFTEYYPVCISKEKNIYFTFKEDMLKIMANQCKNKTWKLFSVTEIKLKEIQYKY